MFPYRLFLTTNFYHLLTFDLPAPWRNSKFLAVGFKTLESHLRDTPLSANFCFPHLVGTGYSFGNIKAISKCPHKSLLFQFSVLFLSCLSGLKKKGKFP